MKRIATGVLGLIVALAAFYGVRELKHQKTGRAPSSAEMSQEMDRLRAIAAREHPNLPPTDAAKEVVFEESAKKMRSQSSGQQRQTAANMFWGFYFLNTRTRVEYCAQRNVDLAPFVHAFTASKASEYAAARAVYSSAGIDPESLLEPGGAELMKVVEQDMKDVAVGAQVPVDQACDLFNEYADELADFIQLPPHVQQALVNEG